MSADTSLHQQNQSRLNQEDLKNLIKRAKSTMNRNLIRNFNRDKMVTMNNLFKSSDDGDINEKINDPEK